MLKSVPGLVNAQKGFTLLEMMIVLVIIGIATTLASVSAFGNNNARALRQDASRLAHLFTAAQAEALTSGQPIAWYYDTDGYEFSRLPRRLILPARLAARAHQPGETAIGDDTALRSRKWLTSDAVSVRIIPNVGLTFGSEWLPGPIQIELEADGRVIKLSRLGNGRFVVEP